MRRRRESPDEEFGVGLVVDEGIAWYHQDLAKELQHHLLDLDHSLALKEGKVHTMSKE